MALKLDQVGPFQLLLVAVVAIFGGRAFQMFWWDAPLRVILWDEQLMTPILSQFGINWSEYVQNPSINQSIEVIQIAWGGLLVIGVLIAFRMKQLQDISSVRFIYWTASLSLFFLAFLQFKDRHYQVGQFIEYALQVGTPLFYWYYMKRERISSKLAGSMLLACGLTFIGHGLYAYGYHPVPGHFQQMVMSILGVGNENALLFLKWAGILDFIAAAFLLLPRRMRIVGLGYMVIWGIATTLARLWANFPYETFSFLLERWFFEFLIRLPHFMIPVLLILHYSIAPGSRQA